MSCFGLAERRDGDLEKFFRFVSKWVKQVRFDRSGLDEEFTPKHRFIKHLCEDAQFRGELRIAASYRRFPKVGSY